MKKVSSRNQSHYPQGQSSKPPSYYWQTMREHDDGHPLDVAVSHIVQQKAARKGILRFQRSVLAALEDKEKKTFLALEELRNKIADDREQAYFNLGYQHGLADRLARHRRGREVLSQQATQLVTQIRERIVQMQLRPREAMLGLLECLWAVAATTSDSK